MASKRRIRRNACEGKQRHPDKDSAIGHATAHKHRFKEYLRAYHCRFCKGWHVGHIGGAY